MRFLNPECFVVQLLRRLPRCALAARRSCWWAALQHSLLPLLLLRNTPMFLLQCPRSLPPSNQPSNPPSSQPLRRPLLLQRLHLRRLLQSLHLRLPRLRPSLLRMYLPRPPRSLPLRSRLSLPSPLPVAHLKVPLFKALWSHRVPPLMCLMPTPTMDSSSAEPSTLLLTSPSEAPKTASPRAPLRAPLPEDCNLPRTPPLFLSRLSWRRPKPLDFPAPRMLTSPSLWPWQLPLPLTS